MPTIRSLVKEPTEDFRISDHGSIMLLTPLSEDAETWIEDNIGEGPDVQTWSGSIVIEPRYMANVVEGIQCDGLTIGVWS